MLNPNVSPPNPGTQSGILKFSLFNNPITALIPSTIPRIMPLIKPMIPLITPLIVSLIPSHTEVKVSLIGSKTLSENQSLRLARKFFN